MIKKQWSETALPILLSNVLHCKYYWERLTLSILLNNVLHGLYYWVTSYPHKERSIEDIFNCLTKWSGVDDKFKVADGITCECKKMDKYVLVSTWYRTGQYWYSNASKYHPAQTGNLLSQWRPTLLRLYVKHSWLYTTIHQLFCCNLSTRSLK